MVFILVQICQLGGNSLHASIGDRLHRLQASLKELEIELEVERLGAEVIRSQIWDFYPTPASLAQKMLDLARQSFCLKEATRRPFEVLPDTTVPTRLSCRYKFKGNTDACRLPSLDSWRSSNPAG
ncbi:MAG: hypothetical protein HC890_17160 [Chloroflexaceae bacterium]|nr:hypothetical protein [Chloroflexaceae bacterium]